MFMGYYNPFLRYGLEAFASDASDAGLDGLIVPDLPTEEVTPLKEVCDPKGIHIIPLLAPTSTESRVAASCAEAKGFVYCISVTGVTGARTEFSANLSQLVSRVRKHTELPIMVGFGVSNREHVEAIGKIADGVVVGSALIDTIANAQKGREAQAAVEFVRQLKGS